MADDAVVGELPVQVLYAPAPPAVPVILTLMIAPGATIAEVLIKSNIAAQVPGLDVSASRVGIWGKLQEPDTVVPAHGRIEIYRPLIADPKEARRRRAVGKSSDKS